MKERAVKKIKHVRYLGYAVCEVELAIRKFARQRADNLDMVACGKFLLEQSIRPSGGNDE
jgi:hypothetical protein